MTPYPDGSTQWGDAIPPSGGSTPRHDDETPRQDSPEEDPMIATPETDHGETARPAGGPAPPRGGPTPPAEDKPRGRTSWRYHRETEPTVTTTVRIPLSLRNEFTDYLDQHEVTISTALARSLRLLFAQNSGELTMEQAVRSLRTGDPRAKASGRKVRPK